MYFNKCKFTAGTINNSIGSKLACEETWSINGQKQIRGYVLKKKMSVSKLCVGLGCTIQTSNGSWLKQYAWVILSIFGQETLATEICIPRSFTS